MPSGGPISVRRNFISVWVAESQRLERAHPELGVLLRINVPAVQRRRDKCESCFLGHHVAPSLCPVWPDSFLQRNRNAARVSFDVGWVVGGRLSSGTELYLSSNFGSTFNYAFEFSNVANSFSPKAVTVWLSWPDRYR